LFLKNSANYIISINLYFSPKKWPRNEKNNRNPVFMEGVSGVRAIFDQPRLNNIQRKVQDFCKWDK